MRQKDVITNYMGTSERNVPEWMLQRDNYDKSCRENRNRFLHKTVAEISSVMHNELLAERFASRDGILQSVDARLKFVSVLVFIIFAGAARTMTTLVLLTAVALLLVRLSRLEMVPYIKRVWLIFPLIVFIMSLPASTNLVIDGKPLFYLYRQADLSLPFIKLPRELFISAEGITAAVKMALRVGISISFGYLLIMTTQWSRITKALLALKVPKLIVTILDMTYRYIFSLSTTALEMFEARNARTVGRIKNKSSRSFISTGIALLFIKANYLSEMVYESMICRCYEGEPVSLVEFKFSKVDLVWTINTVFILLILMIL